MVLLTLVEFRVSPPALGNIDADGQDGRIALVIEGFVGKFSPAFLTASRDYLYLVGHGSLHAPLGPLQALPDRLAVIGVDDVQWVHIVSSLRGVAAKCTSGRVGVSYPAILVDDKGYRAGFYEVAELAPFLFQCLLRLSASGDVPYTGHDRRNLRVVHKVGACYFQVEP